MLVGEKGLTCAGGKLFSFFRVMLREIVGSIFLSRRLFFSLTEGISFSHGGYFYLSQSAQSSRSIFAHSFELIREWPLPQPLPRREGRDM